MISYDEEKEEEEKEDEDKERQDDEDDIVEEVNMSFACEDCDYRWEATFESEEEGDEIQYCPMCGTSNTTQI